MKKIHLCLLGIVTLFLTACTVGTSSNENSVIGDDDSITNLTVTFDFNGGTYDSKTTTTLDVKPTTYFRYAKEKLTETITPPEHCGEVIGYSFSSDDKDNLIPDDYVIRQNIMVYAQYGPKEGEYCTVNWLDGETSEIIKTETYFEGETPEFKGTIPYHKDKAFDHWEPEIHAVTQSEIETGYVSYKAVYILSLYHDVVLDYNDGSTSEEHTQKVLEGECAIEPDISKDGYTLKEWRYVNGGTFDFNTPITKDGIKIEAIWELNKYAVTWLNYDGTPLEAKTKEYGGGDIPNYDGDILPTRESDGVHDYVFAGWLPTPDKIHSDMTYVATYDVISYDTQVCLGVNIAEDGQTFKFSCDVQSGTPAITIDWGDGSSSNDPVSISHTYVESGNYIIRVNGNILNIAIDGDSKGFVESIYLGRTITSIGNSTFEGCLQLKSVTFAENSTITSIPSDAFSTCSSLASITIPRRVNSISDHTFSSCPNLSTLQVNPGNSKYTSQDTNGNPCNAIFTKDGKTLVIGCKTTQIPSSVTSISEYAFAGCTGLLDIVIPKNVITMNEHVFDDCGSLIIYCEAESQPSTWNTNWNSYRYPCCWGYIGKGEEGNYSYAITKDGSYIAKYEGSETTINIPGTLGGQPVVGIGDNVFTNYLDLTSVTLPNSLQKIGLSAFENCVELPSITIPSNVTSIGVRAFGSCTYLQTVTFGEGSKLEIIRESAFQGCSALTSINIPSGVTSIDNCAFRECSQLRTITFEEGSQLASIGEYAFAGCTGLLDIVIPKNVITMNECVFDDCGSLIIYCEAESQPSTWDDYWNPAGCPCCWGYIGKGKEGKYSYAITKDGNYISKYDEDLETTINIPGTLGGRPVVGIGDNVFAYYLNLTSVALPDSLQKIGNRAFISCEELKTITFGEESQLASIGDGAFRDCSALIDFTIPSSVTSIGESAFKECRSLTSIIIPNGVSSIGNSTFEFCSGLTSINIPSSVTSIGDDAFERCSNLQTVTFDSGSKLTSIGDYAFYNCSSLESITIPNSVTSIGWLSFERCSQLKTVDLTAYTTSSTIPQYDSNIFKECSSELKFYVASEEMKSKFAEKGWPKDKIVVGQTLSLGERNGL